MYVARVTNESVSSTEVSLYYMYIHCMYLYKMKSGWAYNATWAYTTYYMYIVASSLGLIAWELGLERRPHVALGHKGRIVDIRLNQ